ncbi:hypothetical protein HOD96_01230 [Candidatus Falkowbacteria bacterium]|jgi:hypothetical protein|nr:hypothetical protein [Candidatus Falkowbacteria bacterium]MBT4432942.1 hypothetical protein [Candidatus Falkowbacteria bacterium]
MFQRLKQFILGKLNTKLKKIAFNSFLISFLILFILLFLYWPRDMSKGVKPIYGLNFSQKYANDLGLNWQETYLTILDELKPKRMRVSAHWDLIEKEKGQYNFSNLDWQIEEAGKRGVQIILAIGRRTPRWPECHPPQWSKNLTEDKKEKYILRLLEAEIKHFKNFDNIVYWQIENEHFLDIFGECPDGDEKLLDKEIALVKSLSNKPIILTDSGELSTWKKLAKKTDVLGTSMYKTVWNPYWGFFTYPLPPAFYYYKAKINQYFNNNLQKVIITELQGEAWANAPLNTLSIEKQLQSMNKNKLKNNLEYAKQSGLNEIYIWGAEWWYWLKLQGEDSLWQTAKNIL